MSRRPSYEDVERAAARIAPYVHRTPVLTSASLDEQLGLRAFFKCENLQKIGAFKARGAVNAVLSLDEAAAARGVLTHSSGNHGQALAYAAAVRGISCAVVVPDDAPSIKVDAIAGYGARIVSGPRSAREEIAAAEAAASGAELIHPYDHPDVIAGQGTAARELLEDHSDLDVIITPIGGGGLMSGTAVTARALAPDTRLIGGEPTAAANAHRSLEAGTLQPPLPEPISAADGLLSAPSHRTFEILQSSGVSVTVVSESEILDAARFHLERMKLVVEPSGAVALAVLRALADELPSAMVGVIVTGGNTDFAWLGN